MPLLKSPQEAYSTRCRELMQCFQEKWFSQQVSQGAIRQGVARELPLSFGRLVLRKWLTVLRDQLSRVQFLKQDTAEFY